MKTRIHVNQHKIKRNRKHGANEPVLTAMTYKGNEYGHVIEVNGPCKIIYSPDKPLSCGAHVWIETDADVAVTDKNIDSANEWNRYMIKKGVLEVQDDNT